MIPRAFGRYEVHSEIGDGAMGRVYRGFDPLVRRPVAIKTLKRDPLGPGEERDALARFRREAQAAGALSHPNIVAIFDVGEDYLVMELLDGVPLHALLYQRGPLDLEQTVGLLQGVGEALDHAHRAGVVHRDVKPANIMVLPDGRTKLMDFGLARVESRLATRPGDIFGSPSYMAPEQVAGEGVGERVDTYALAVVAYECLVGRKPFEGDTIPGIVYRVLHEPPPPACRLRPELPAHCDTVFARALAKRPAERFDSASAFVEALRGPATERPQPAEPADELVRADLAQAVSALRSASAALGSETRTYDDLRQPVAAARRQPAAPPAESPPAAPGPDSRPTPRTRRAPLWVGAATLLALVLAAGWRRWQPEPHETPARVPGIAPVAAEARVDVTSEPAGARVRLDGRDRGTAPLQLGPLAIGPHELELELAGYSPARLTFHVEAGVSPAPLAFALQPLTARLSVISHPRGAAVRLGGKPLGSTPLERVPVEPGVYDLQLARAGYAPWQRTVSADPGEHNVIEVDLNQRQAPLKVAPGDLVARDTPGVQPPEKLKPDVPLSYPAEAQAKRQQGTVLVGLIVDEHGLPTKLRVLQSAGALLDRHMLEHVQRWRYKPARLNGVPVRYPEFAKGSFIKP